MKRLFLYVIAIVIISVSSVFATAFDAVDIDQLISNNRFKADFKSVGVLFGTDAWRFAVSLNGKATVADYLTFVTDDSDTYGSSGYVGFGYKAPAFGLWLGYEFFYDNQPTYTPTTTSTKTYENVAWVAHAPHIQFTALDNNLRVNIPVFIGTGMKKESGDYDLEGVTAYSTEIQVRYYTQTDYFTLLRAYVYAGMYDFSKAKYNENLADDDKIKNQSSFGFQIRFYFNIPNDTPLKITPRFQVYLDKSLGNGFLKDILAKNAPNVGDIAGDGNAPTEIQFRLALGLSGTIGIISITSIPNIRAVTTFEKDTPTVTDIIIANYMEFYIYPIPDVLQIYLEFDSNYTVTGDDTFGIAAGSGVRWFF